VSKDGKQIAFASDRYGNFDVFTLPVTGVSTRLTFNSAADYPYDFSPDRKMFYLVLAVKRAAITFILLAAFVPKLIHGCGNWRKTGVGY
jgi:hypothetical protein